MSSCTERLSFTALFGHMNTSIKVVKVYLCYISSSTEVMVLKIAQGLQNEPVQSMYFYFTALLLFMVILRTMMDDKDIVKLKLKWPKSLFAVLSNQQKTVPQK